MAEEKKSLENLYKQKQGVSARRKGSPPTIYKVMSEQQLDKKINTIAIWTSWETTELTLSLSHSQLLQLSSMGHKFWHVDMSETTSILRKNGWKKDCKLYNHAKYSETQRTASLLMRYSSRISGAHRAILTVNIEKYSFTASALTRRRKTSLPTLPHSKITFKDKSQRSQSRIFDF